MTEPACDFEVEELAFHQRVATARVLIPPESRWVQGHFPGHPILPGVAQARIAHDLLERSLGTGVHLTSIPRMKFTSPVRPGTRLEVRLEFDAAGDRVKWSFTDGRVAVSTGEFRFARGA